MELVALPACINHPLLPLLSAYLVKMQWWLQHAGRVVSTYCLVAQCRSESDVAHHAAAASTDPTIALQTPYHVHRQCYAANAVVSNKWSATK
jgi:hypothetical protein